jgi:tryptophan-rich sensory protein
MSGFKLRDVIAAAIFILVSEAAGIIGAIFTTDAVATWYPTLTKPSFNPPNWLFGPVWTTLYALMGVAAFLIWRHGWSAPGVKIALALFAAQLILNSLWSIIFFGMHALLPAFIEIIFLWVLILATIVAFLRVSPGAAGLLVPYILWVSFASLLNFSLWRLNV